MAHSARQVIAADSADSTRAQPTPVPTAQPISAAPTAGMVQTTASTVTVTLFAAARDAAGVSEVVLPAGPVDDVLDALLAASPPALARVLPICSLMVDGQKVSGGQLLSSGAVLHVLPPFAGG